MKLRADANFAFDPNVSAMSFDQVFGDGQAQASPAGLTGTRSVHAIESLENAGLIGLRNADAGIRNGQNHIVTPGVSAKNGLSLRQCVLNGIVQQILQDLLQAASIAGYVGKRSG